MDTKHADTPRARLSRGATGSDAPAKRDAHTQTAPAHTGCAGEGPAARAVDPDAPQWARLPRPRETLRGLTRSFLWQLCDAGRVRSIVVRGQIRGRVRKSDRGCRLICLRSLDAYLAGLAAEQTEGKQ